MRKIMKKVAVFTLLCSFLVGIPVKASSQVDVLADSESSNGVLYSDENELSEIMADIASLYDNDPEFLREAENRGMAIEQLLREKAMDIYQTEKYIEANQKVAACGMGNNGQNLYANVPLIQQTNGYNCGPTSALQALYGVSCQNNVAGSTNAEKINQLSRDSGTDSSGTYVYMLTNTLNKYTNSVKYAYTLGSSMTESQFQSKVEGSLLYDVAPIVHARTQYLPYYHGHSSGHYIVIAEVDKTNKTIRLKDCNYSNSYYGDHVVSVTNVYQSIAAESDRYLISLSSR